MSHSVRIAWLLAAGSIIASGAAIAVVGLTVDFVRTLVATFVGATLGFLVALYIDRVQRADADVRR